MNYSYSYLRYELFPYISFYHYLFSHYSSSYSTFHLKGGWIKIRPQKPLNSRELSREPQYLEKKRFLDSKNRALIINIQSPREKNISLPLNNIWWREGWRVHIQPHRKRMKDFSCRGKELQRGAKRRRVSLWVMLHFPPRLSPVVKTTGNPRWV